MKTNKEGGRQTNESKIGRKRKYRKSKLKATILRLLISPSIESFGYCSHIPLKLRHVPRHCHKYEHCAFTNTTQVAYEREKKKL